MSSGGAAQNSDGNQYHPADKEIRERLDQLRGQQTARSSKSFLVSGRAKSQADEVNDLLKQYSAETQLVKQFNETSIDVDKQIEERLRRLKADRITTTTSTPISLPTEMLYENCMEESDESDDDSDQDDIRAEKLMKKILAEEALNRRQIIDEINAEDDISEDDFR